MFLKKIKKKTLLHLGAFVASVATLSVAVACSNDEIKNNSTATFLDGVITEDNLPFDQAKSNLETIAKAAFGEEYTGSSVTVGNVIPNTEIPVALGRQVFDNVNGEFPNQFFRYDQSFAYGSAGIADFSKFAPQIIRTASVGQTLLKVTPVAKADGGIKNTIKILQPSLAYYKLEIAEAVEITLKDGTIKYYDSDAHEKLPDFGESFKETSYRLSSDQANSINNPQFLEDLKNAKQFSISVKKDIPWVNYKGEKSDYVVEAEDILTSYLRTKMYEVSFRRSNGGSKDLDDILYAETTHQIFENTSRFPNEYLYDLFGIRGDLLSEKAKAITTNSKGDKAYTVYANESSGSQKLDFAFDALFIDSYLYVIAPTKYIKADENQELNTITGKTSSTSTEQITRKAENLAKEIGTYWYGKNREKMLFASAYVPKFIDKFKKVETAEINPFFVDQKWVKSKTSLKNLTSIYGKNTDVSALANRLYNAFAGGTITELGLSRLPDDKRDALIKGTDESLKPINNFLDYSISKNFSSSVNVFWWLSYPKPNIETTNKKGEKIVNEPNYSFNDSYAKIVYGATIDELKKGTAKSTKQFYDGDGVTFRTILSSVINLVTQANNLSANSSLSWFPHFATDISLAGSNHNKSKEKTPRDGFEKLNSTFVAQDRTKKVATSYQDFLNGSSNAISEKAFRNPKYNELKKIMTALLDKPEYSSITKDNPIEATISYFLIAWDETRTKNLESTIKALNGLDDKGRLKFVGIKPAQSENLYPHFIQQQGLSEVNGWNSDYDGAGTFLHASIYGDNKTLIGALSLFAQQETNQAFPQIQKVAKAMQENVDSLNALDDNKNSAKNKLHLRFNKPFNSWKEITNAEGTHVKEYLEYTDPVSKKVIDPDTEIARFGLWYQDQITNQEWIDLIQELTLIANSPFSRRNLTNNLETGTAFLRQPGFIVARSTSKAVYYQDRRVLIRK